MKINAWYILIFVALGFLLGWLIKPSGSGVINRIIKPNYTEFVTDTLLKTDTVQIEKIVLKQFSSSAERDTIILRDEDLSGDRQAQTDSLQHELKRYETSRENLISSGFQRIKSFRAYSEQDDTVRVQLESVRDSIMKLEIRHAAREVVSRQLNKYYVAAENNNESWYIHPAIGLAGGLLGFAVGSVR